MRIRSLVAAARARLGAGLLLLASASGCGASPAAVDPRDPHSPLRLVRIIKLPNVRGRLDHLAFDAARDRLFVAELGNGTVDEVDIRAGKVTGRIAGLSEPQGIGWLPRQQEIVVACGDGNVVFYGGTDRREVARLSLGDDADNVRVDAKSGAVLVGYGSGGVAVIDPSTHWLVGDVKLPGHPEAFAIVAPKIYVNVPHRASIVAADMDGRVIAAWSIGSAGANYPMAADAAGARIAIGFRAPASVSVIETATGKPLWSRPACGDADDIFIRRDTILLVCGEGSVDLVAMASGQAVGRVATARGARTGLFVAERDRLFVAVPGRGGAAELWELAPAAGAISAK